MPFLRKRTYTTLLPLDTDVKPDTVELTPAPLVTPLLPLGLAVTLADALWLALELPGLEVGCALEPGFDVLPPLLGDGVGDAEGEAEPWLDPPLEDVGPALLCGSDVTPGEEVAAAEDSTAEEATSLGVTGSEVGVAEPVSGADAVKEEVGSVEISTAEEAVSEMSDMMRLKICIICREAKDVAGPLLCL